MIQKGHHLYQIICDSLKVRFLRTNLFVPGNELTVAKFVGLKVNDVFFPSRLNYIENYHYRGEIPSLTNYFALTDNQNTMQRKIAYHKTLVKSCKQWCFVKELFEYCDFLLWTLSHSMLIFIKECFVFKKI